MLKASYLLRPAKLPTAYCLLKTCLLLTATLLPKLHAQQAPPTSQDPQIMVMARPTQEGKIMLRWAVTTPRAWRQLNTYGYALTRYTLTRNGTTLPQPVAQDLGTFLPQPLEAWMPIIETNDNAAVMAQSLYGERFDVEGMDELSAIVNLAEEQEQRFTWGLYAADQDYETAQRAGLGYTDSQVQPNEKYVYKVTALVPESELAIAEGGVFIGLQDYEALPKPLDLAGVFMDGKVMLSWNYAIHKQQYNSYFIERSEGNGTFKRLNPLPLTSLNHSDKTDPKRMFYIDSITNGPPYRYRIVGKTVFGELSPASEEVSGKGQALLAYVPRIATQNYLDDTRVVLTWEFPEEGNAHIKGFHLNRSDKAEGRYRVVVPNLSPKARKLQYDSLQPTNYFTLTAIGKNGSKRTSFPVLVQPVDSVPPAPPVGLTGKIDSLGRVTLTWQPNTEKDILGYRLFRGHTYKEEYTQITVSPHQGATYYDSVPLQTLNAKVYYQLIAVDQRFNQSKPSETLEIAKPDLIPPAQAVFRSYALQDGQVQLTWANSSSQDVVRHEIYRRTPPHPDWVLVHTALPTAPLQTAQLPTATWTDIAVIEGKSHHYTLIAIDASGLESEPAPPLTVIVPKTTLPPPVQGLASYMDKRNGFIELYWRPYKAPDVAELAIYKGLRDQPLSLLRHVAPSVKRIVDERVKPNNKYVYGIRPVFTDGRVGAMAMLPVNY